MRTRWRTLVPYLLALMFAAWGLRGARTCDIVDTDAARHAMNGAFLHDLIRDAEFTRAAEYAKEYYSRLPALSMPYHPPLFPLVESLAFFALGVNVFAARLLVALAVVATSVLLHNLVLKTHASHLLAFLTTATFLSVNGSQRLASDVMLEFPALALALVSLYFLTRLKPRLGMRSAVAFAIAAGVALWTKQNLVFLGAVPFALVVISREWSLLRHKPVWAAGLLFGAAVAGVTALQKSSPLAANAEWPRTTLLQTAAVNASLYAGKLREEFGAVAAVFMLASAVVFGTAKRRTPNDLYVAWIVCGILLMLVLPPADPRYGFFVYPAMILIAYAALDAAGRKLLPRRAVWALPVGAAVAWFAAVARPATVYLRGPSAAAQTVLASSPRRVLYCGRANGSFIFSMRSLAPGTQPIVIRGDKLPAGVFERRTFDAFASEYGIEQIVLEFSNANRRPWDTLFEKPHPAMELLREIPLETSEPMLSGTLRVFRFTKPSPDPKRTVKLRMMNGEEITIGF